MKLVDPNLEQVYSMITNIMSLRSLNLTIVVALVLMGFAFITAGYVVHPASAKCHRVLAE